MDTREQVIKWLNDNGHAKVTSKIIPLDNGNFRPVVDVIMSCLEQVNSVDLAGVVGRSEQVKCPNCELDYDKEEIEMFRGLCESCRDRAF